MMVIKVGGAAGIDLAAFCRDLADLINTGQKVVLVHGGSHETNVLSARLGRPPKFIISPSGHQSRYTDRETLEIFMMACAGRINKVIVEHLQRYGVNAIGLSGLDGRLIEGPRKKAIRSVGNGRVKIIRDDFSGKAEKVNVELIRLLVAHGYTLVVSPLASSTEGEALNIDADRAAAALACAIKAEKLLILSNVPGLLKDPQDEASLVPCIPREALEEYSAFARGRMKKKMLATSEALAGGISKVILADARVEKPITRALEGKGTVIH